MEKSIYEPDNQIISAFQPFSGSEESLSQVADVFPMPIEIFKPDGTVAFVNRSWLKIHNIPSQVYIVGTYNVKENPVVNDKLGLNSYVKRLFEGDTLMTPECKAPLEDLATWCQNKNSSLPIESIYMEILCFPIFTPGGNASHFISVFIPTRMYRGNPDVARALEYLDNHWNEGYDTGKVAEAVNLSQSHFTRIFKKQTGMTPYRYYQNVKVKKLKEVLCNKNLTVGEAFRECGVDYSGNFAKIFKQLVGISPSVYRNQLK